MNALPSTSVRVTPRAESATTGKVSASGEATVFRMRSTISRDRGPGISVRSWIVRVVDRTRGYRRSVVALAAGVVASTATAAAPPTLETTHGTRLGKRCDYSGSVSTTPPSKSVEARSVYQDPASCTLVMLVGPPAVVNPATTTHTTLTFAVGRVAHIGADTLAVGPLECTAGLLRPLLARFAAGQTLSLSCRDGAISST